MLVRHPASEADWTAYYEIRWRVLREPWGRPRGSERDELDASSIHFMACLEDGAVAGVARLHFNSPEEAQIRYMAVAPERQGRGAGAALLRAAEEKAAAMGALRAVLNARDNARGFYEKMGYRAVKPMPALFGSIAHWWMEKKLRP
jgi:N-acetylglutamate synthase-like GNAT family acetyltransferase